MLHLTTQCRLHMNAALGAGHATLKLTLSNSVCHYCTDQTIAKYTFAGTLQDLDTNDLVQKRNQILWEQAVKGQQPGLTLMQDR